jgi:YaiO family outer membrane protein
MRWISAWALALLGTTPAPAAAQAVPPAGAPAPPPLVQAVEAGGGLGHYDLFDTANEQFVRYRLSRIDDFSLSAELGRERRFGDLSFRGGLTASKTLDSGLSVTAGWSAGTGEVVAPRYRFDVGVTQPIHDVLTSFIYTRLQRSAANATDGYTIGAVRWFDQWIIQGYGRIEVGSPDRTISTSALIGATWYRWKQIYIGGTVSFGDVSYVLLPGDAVAVDYRAFEGAVVVSRWFNDRSGVNIRANFSDTDIYRLTGFTVSLFREF